MVIKSKEVGERKQRTYFRNKRGTGGDPGEASPSEGDKKLVQGKGRPAVSPVPDSSESINTGDLA